MGVQPLVADGDSSDPLALRDIRQAGEPHGADEHAHLRQLPFVFADGKTMGMDMDGPANDKGLYAVVPVQKT